MDLALNNLQGLICHKTQETKANRRMRMSHIVDNFNHIAGWSVTKHST